MRLQRVELGGTQHSREHPAQAAGIVRFLLDLLEVRKLVLDPGSCTQARMAGSIFQGLDEDTVLGIQQPEVAVLWDR
jgi:hypothetical protein